MYQFFSASLHRTHPFLRSQYLGTNVHTVLGSRHLTPPWQPTTYSTLGASTTRSTRSTRPSHSSHPPNQPNPTVDSTFCHIRLMRRRTQSTPEESQKTAHFRGRIVRRAFCAAVIKIRGVSNLYLQEVRQAVKKRYPNAIISSPLLRQSVGTWVPYCI